MKKEEVKTLGQLVEFINERGEADLKSVSIIYKVCAGNAVNETIYTKSFNNEKEARDYFDYLKNGLLSGKAPVDTDLGYKDSELFHIELVSFPENDVDNIESLDITDEYLRSDI